MKLNWAEELAVNNPLRVVQQRFELRWMKKRSNLPPGSNVLEIGCGRGAGAGLILEAFEPAIFHAMDLDIRMIAKAGRYLPETTFHKISRYVADVSDLPCRDGTMDAVFGFGVLHHIPDWRRALSEISRVLKNGGVYFLEELYPSLYQNFITKHVLLHPTTDRFHSGDIKEALESHGFSIKDSLEMKFVGILAVLEKTR